VGMGGKVMMLSGCLLRAVAAIPQTIPHIKKSPFLSDLW
jgi:hypothetical protein